MFLLTFLALIAVSSSTQSVCNNKADVTVNVTSTWVLPLTNLSDWEGCGFHFNYPSDSFAVVSVYAGNMSLQVQVCDPSNFSSGFCMEGINMYGDYSGHIVSNTSSFNQTVSFPALFTIHVGALKNTKMVVSIKVVIKKNLMGQNVKAISVKQDGPSGLIYAEDMREGQTYTITAQTTIVLMPAYADGNQWALWNNIYIYENGKIRCTLYPTYKNMLSKGTQLQIYIAQTGLTNAAILLTDQSNTIKMEYGYYAQFVPLFNSGNTDYLLLSGGYGVPGFATIIGKKDGSTPYDIRQLSRDNPAANFTYSPGGPTASRLKEVPMDPRNAPIHITGNVNTFYISVQQGSLKYTLD